MIINTFKDILFANVKTRKAKYYKISKENNELITELIDKDDISNFNDKRYHD